MANYSIHAKRFGLKKESTRLTAEAAPDVWLTVEPDSEFYYKLNNIKDTGVRGVRAHYPGVAGQKECTGVIKTPARAQNIGEILVSLLGAPTTTQPGTLAYKHQWLAPLASITPPTYTWFVDRSIGVVKYNGVACKKLTVDSPIDGAVMVTAEMIGLTEASGSIGSPTYSESEQMAFWRVTPKVAGSTVTNIKSWSLSIDPGLIAKRAQTVSQDPADMIHGPKMKVEGSFEVYHETVTERDKFLASTASSLQFSIAGAANAIEASHTYEFDLLIPKGKYVGFEFSELDEILATSVKWEAEYDTSTSKLIDVFVKNTKTAY